MSFRYSQAGNGNFSNGIFFPVLKIVSNGELAELER